MLGGWWVNTIKPSEDKIKTCSLGVVRKHIKCVGTNCVQFCFDILNPG